MNIGLYQSVSGMKSMWEDQQVIAANLARSQTPGHKASFAAFFNESTEASRNEPSLLNNSPTMIQPYIDFTSGVMEGTQNQLDFAIRGDGFFTVQEKDGTVSYTRNGQFTRDVNGVLKLHDGATVLGGGGAKITIPDANYISVDNAGTIFADGEAVGKLGLVKFENPSEDVTPNPNGRFAALEGKTPKAVGAETSVAQGFLEKSNTDSIHEMVRMMEVMRTYQANQQMIAAQDGVTEKLIETAGGK